ncbi:hypothetical protein [Curtobacterium luteum]|uniref:hypothetical protein n=1 Tax=Curtobacterium luteum TaxID=33881 RepID=UPI0038263526
MHEPLPIIRASAMHEAGADATTLRRRTTREGPDRLVRVGPNAFVHHRRWDAAGPRQRYVTRVYARLGRLGTRATASHDSAAALHGLPALHGWDVPVHATVPTSMYRGRTDTLVLHTRPAAGHDRVPAGAIHVTTVPRTVADIALVGDFRSGVAVADAALRAGWARESLHAAVGRTARGRVLASSIIEFADGRSGSPAESLARVVFRELGLPTPVLQQPFVVGRRRYEVDFWFPDEGVVVEVDGLAKYTQSRYRNGRTQEQVILDEKRRHEALLAVPAIRTIIRLEWRDLFDLEALALRLRSAGLPCAHRPVRSARDVRR